MLEKIKLLVLGTAEKFRWLAPLLVRMVIGSVFIQTGWGKLHSLGQVTDFFRSLGIPAPELQAPFVASVEFGGGILVLLGLFSRLAALPLMGTMVVAILTAKLKEFTGPLDLFGAQEFDYLVLLFTLFIYGAGPVSVDQFICKRCAGTAKIENK